MNGPSIAGHATQVAVAWFTRPESRDPQVRLARSRDAGEHFGQVVTIDQERPLGRPAVAVLSDGSAFVCWLRRAAGHSELCAARVVEDGRIATQWTIATVSAGRASGFPRVTADGLAAIVCWTNGNAPDSTVRAVRVSFAR